MGENYIEHLQIIIVPQAQEASYTLPNTAEGYVGKIIFLEGSHTIFVNGIKYVASSEAEYAQLERDVTAAITALTTNHMTTATTSDGVTTYQATDKIGDLDIDSLSGSPFATVTALATALKSYADTTFVKTVNSQSRDATGDVTINGTHINVGGTSQQAVGNSTLPNVTLTTAFEDIYSQIGQTADGGALHLYSGATGTTAATTVTADGGTYRLVQGTTEVARFQIEKDSFVKEGALVYGPSTGLTSGTAADPNESAQPAAADTSDPENPLPERKTPYLKLVVKTTDNTVENYIYIAASDLVEIYTGTVDSNDTGVTIAVDPATKAISASLHIKNGTDGDTVSGTAAAANGVTKTSYVQVANSVSVTTTNGTVTDATVGTGVSADAAGAANAAYTDAVAHVTNLGGTANDTVSGTAAAANGVTKTSYVQVADSAQVTTSGGEVSGVELGAGVSADAAGAANAAYSDAVSYTNTKVGQVVSWEVVGASQQSGD